MQLRLVWCLSRPRNAVQWKTGGRGWRKRKKLKRRQSQTSWAFSSGEKPWTRDRGCQSVAMTMIPFSPTPPPSFQNSSALPLPMAGQERSKSCAKSWKGRRGAFFCVVRSTAIMKQIRRQSRGLFLVGRRWLFPILQTRVYTQVHVFVRGKTKHL